MEISMKHALEALLTLGGLALVFIGWPLLRETKMFCFFLHRPVKTDESGIYSWYWCPVCKTYRIKIYE